MRKGFFNVRFCTKRKVRKALCWDCFAHFAFFVRLEKYNLAHFAVKSQFNGKFFNRKVRKGFFNVRFCTKRKVRKALCWDSFANFAFFVRDASLNSLRALRLNLISLKSCVELALRTLRFCACYKFKFFAHFAVKSSQLNLISVKSKKNSSITTKSCFKTITFLTLLTI